MCGSYWLLVFLSCALWATKAMHWTLDHTDETKSFLTAYKDHPFRHDPPTPANLEFLRDKTIIFFGDSLTRYQFLSLGMFLTHGAWYDDWGLIPVTHPFNGWPKFFYYTSYRMGCGHICDCANDVGHQENRYHYHVGLNFSMIAFFFAPSQPLTFTLDHHPSRQEMMDICTDEEVSLRHLQATLVINKKRYRTYNGVDVADFITKEVKEMQPDALFFNQGLWPAGNFRSDESIERLVKAMKDASPNPFWKVTTAVNDNPGKTLDHPEFMEKLISHGLGTFDTFSITKELSPYKDLYWDRAHFKHFFYREANLALLEMLRTLFTPNVTEPYRFPLIGVLPARANEERQRLNASPNPN